MKNKLLYKENFTKDGYVIIKNFLKKSEINKLKKDLINGYKKHLNKNITQRRIDHIIDDDDHELRSRVTRIVVRNHFTTVLCHYFA